MIKATKRNQKPIDKKPALKKMLFIVCFFSSISAFAQTREDSVVYMFSFERIKATDTTQRDTYMYTPIYYVTVDKQLKQAKQGANSLEDQLRKYIIAEMGDVLYTNKPCQCIVYFTSKKQAREARQKSIEASREKGFDVMDTPFSFSFKWPLE